MALLGSVCFATELVTIPLKLPVKEIKGRVVGRGSVNPGVEIQVFDHPEVGSDDSLSLSEKRKKQSVIAMAVTDNSGNFTAGHVSKGSYEVVFSKPGWDTVSVTVTVDPSRSHDHLCVNMPISEAGGGASVEPCDSHHNASNR